MTPTQEVDTPVQLTFVSERHSGYYGVYTMSVGCLEAKQPCLGEPQMLFERQERIIETDWSPNGKQIAFIGFVDGESDIFIADWDGKNIKNLTNSPGSEWEPKWSPDGIRLAYVYSAFEPPQVIDFPQIRIYDLGTGQIAPALHDVLNPGKITWLAKGSLVAYSTAISSTDGRTQIVVAEFDGTILYALPPNAKDFTRISGFSFSPDGQHLAFLAEIVSPTRHSSDIYVISLDGSDEIKLTNGAGNYLDPIWSPVGDWIVFDVTLGDEDGIWMIRPDGSGLFNIGLDPLTDSDPAWRLVPSP
jgi:TolB protein